MCLLAKEIAMHRNADADNGITENGFPGIVLDNILKCR